VNPHGLNETLALLDSLKSAAGDFAAREEKLNQEFTRAANKELTAFEAATGALETKLSHFSAAAEVAADHEEARRAKLSQRRTTAINRAHAAARKQAERASDDYETRLNDSARANTTLAERRREEELASEIVRFQNFQQTLNDSAAALTQQEAAALKAFGGIAKFRRWLGQSWPEPDFSPDENGLLAEFNRLAAKTDGDLSRFRKFPGPNLFRFVPVWLASALLLAAGATLLLQRFDFHYIPPPVAEGCLAGFVCVWIFYWLALRSTQSPAREIAEELFQARRLLDGGYEKSAQHHAAEQQRIKDEAGAAIRKLNQDWKQQIRDLAGARLNYAQAADEKASRAMKHNTEHHRAAMDAFKQQQAEALSATAGGGALASAPGNHRANPPDHRRSQREHGRPEKSPASRVAGAGRRLEEGHPAAVVGDRRNKRRRRKALSRMGPARFGKLDANGSLSGSGQGCAAGHQPAGLCGEVAEGPATRVSGTPRIFGASGAVVSVAGFHFVRDRAARSRRSERGDQQFDFPPARVHPAGPVELHNF
jgi:hypothetical protein